MGTLHEDQCTFFIISCSLLLIMRNVSTNVVQKIKHTFYIQLCFLKICAYCEIMWKSTVEPGSPQMTIWCIHIARCYLGLQTHTVTM